MANNQHAAQHHGLNVSPDPLSDMWPKDGPPEQRQEWPGTDSEMQPKADHGQETYVGAGKLQGKTALITGGDSGIGRAVAIAFAREGADVAISYYNEHDDAEETVRWVEEAGRQALAMPGDVKDPEHCKALVDRTVNELGGINILVNNAAYQRECPNFLEVGPDEIDETFRTNIYAYIWMAQAAIPHMSAGDAVINSGSVVAMMGYPSLMVYAATKGAIHNFTKSLSQAVAERGIRVNCVAPGPVWTPLITSTCTDELISSFGANTLWKRPAQPAELAPSYVFLASADSRYYTGEVLAETGFRFTSR